jgi:hypothetical protein
MARPRKADPDNLRALLRARCSREEKAAILAKARTAGLTESAYLRRVAVNSNVLPADPLYQLVIAINRAGNLINQQMGIAHARGEFPSELLRANAALEAALNAVSDALGQ